MNIETMSHRLRLAENAENQTHSATDALSVYRKLLSQPRGRASQHLAQSFLEEQLAVASATSCDLPEDPYTLPEWASQSLGVTTRNYAQYLAARKSGEPRRYFTTHGHALSFITKVAPTKLVDGAWLYGTLEHWSDIRFQALIRTYLEELGNGEPSQNHVSLYKQLLAAEGCDAVDGLDAKYYLQGAIQLALGYRASEFLPELIGYNLGYEQLPLHLLISAHELRELGIDPYYFSLHVTIDNASSGHARQAVQALLDNLPATDAKARSFYERVKRGYMLNNVGPGSVAVIEAFDHEQEVIEILQRKSRFAQVHSDYCRVDGLTVNEWLADPQQIPQFLAAMKRKGWIKLDQNPERSRFWTLLHGPGAAMFGVFSPYELTIIQEWIAGTWRPGISGSRASGPQTSVATLHRPPADHRTGADTERPGGGHLPLQLADIDGELEALRNELETLPTRTRMQRLIELMAPGKHHSAAGLMATKTFAQQMFANLRRLEP